MSLSGDMVPTGSLRGGTPLVNALLPEERALVQLEQLSNALFKATTIPDVRKLIGMAEALSEATRAMEASERLQGDSMAMIIKCKRRLGDLTREIPKNRYGTPPKLTAQHVPKILDAFAAGETRRDIGKRVGTTGSTITKILAAPDRYLEQLEKSQTPSRQSLIKQAGLTQNEVCRAEALSVAGDKVDLAISALMPSPTTSGVLRSIGYKGSLAKERVARRARVGFARLAEDAVGLLKLLADKRRAPTRAEAKDFANRLALLNAGGEE